MNSRLRFLVMVAIGVLTFAPVVGVQAQGRFAHGAVVALRGTPHLWIADEYGVLHWAGDTWALVGRHVVWSDRTEVTLAQLRQLYRGDPWLSAGLLKDGDAIYLVKWETDWVQPQLFHIQSIADVELFGINGSNYGYFVWDRAAWEQAWGISAGGLQRFTLSAATVQSVPQEVMNSWAAYDQRIRRALALLWDYNILTGESDWRSEYGWPLAHQRTEIVWGNIRAGGLFDFTNNRIVINQSYQHEPLPALAAVLAHEVHHAIHWWKALHAQSFDPTTFAAACLKDEMVAFAWTGAAWELFRSGLDDYWTDGELLAEEAYQAWKGERLREFVLTSEGYQQQCLGSVLPDF